MSLLFSSCVPPTRPGSFVFWSATIYRHWQQETARKWFPLICLGDLIELWEFLAVDCQSQTRKIKDDDKKDPERGLRNVVGSTIYHKHIDSRAAVYITASCDYGGMHSVWGSATVDISLATYHTRHWAEIIFGIETKRNVKKKKKERKSFSIVESRDSWWKNLNLWHFIYEFWEFALPQ